MPEIVEQLCLTLQCSPSTAQRDMLVHGVRVVLLICVLCAAACGDDDFGEGPHPPLPVVQDLGGPIFSSPRWAVITFPGDPYAAEIDQFVEQLGRSSYWTGLSEYGVGSSSAVPVHVTDPAPTVVDAISAQEFVLAHLHPLATGWPAPDGNTAYVIFYPATTAFSCSQESGFHSSLTLPDGTAVAYAIIPRCSYQIDQFEEVAEVATHELAETATDPVLSARAYATVADFAWEQRSQGGEIGDMCQGTPGAYVMDSNLGHFVQRFWSNEAASLGHDPCIPHLPGDVYFQAAPAANDTVTLSFKSGSPDVTTSGVKIPIHATKTVDVHIFSDGPTAPISVFAAQWPINSQVQQSNDISLSLDRATGENGDTLRLTITVNADSYGEGHEYVIVSAQVGDLVHEWPIVIQN